VEETWAPILSRLAGGELVFETVKETGSEEPVIM
jgi:hypothetical protein